MVDPQHIRGGSADRLENPAATEITAIDLLTGRLDPENRACHLIRAGDGVGCADARGQRAPERDSLQRTASDDAQVADLDHGTEIARHATGTLTTNLTVYFADSLPRATPSNENNQPTDPRAPPQRRTHHRPPALPDRDRRRTQRTTPRNTRLPHPTRTLRTTPPRTATHYFHDLTPPSHLAHYALHSTHSDDANRHRSGDV